MNVPTAGDDVEARVRDFLNAEHRLLIGGAWTAPRSEDRIEVVDPATGEVIAHAAAGGELDIDAAVGAARKAFDDDGWGGVSPGERRRLISAFADAIERDAPMLSLLESMDNGAPLAITRMMVGGAVDCVRYFSGWPGKVTGSTFTVSAPNQHVYSLKEPVGVVGSIVPWNAPLVGAVAKISVALAAGCTVVLKPAELTPLTALRLGHLLQEIDMPAGVVNIVTGYGDPAGRALVEHPGVDKISFTGSTITGQGIVRAAAAQMKRLTLELGGKSPVLIFPDADLDRAIDGAAASIFGNAGQVCVAGSRVYAHRSIYDTVVAGLEARAKALRVGQGRDPSTQMGPLISQRQLDRVSSYIASGVEEGAEIVTGGSKLGGQGFFLQPTVFAQTTRQMKVMREEIFGPVVCVTRIDDDDLDGVARIANDTPYGLSAYIWTRDISRAHGLAKRIKAGGVRINGGVGTDWGMPFGGYKQSGWGRENGLEGLESYLETKSVSVAL